MQTRLVALIPLVVACEAAPLQYQSSETFAMTYGCAASRVTAMQAVHRPGSSYDVFVVRGCGLQQIYYCSVDVGCVRPEEAQAEPGGAPARKLPPNLVDQTPQPPPMLAPDSQSGS